MDTKVTISPFLKRMIDQSSRGDDYELKVQRLIHDLMREIIWTGKEYIEVYPPEPPPASRTTNGVRKGIRKSGWRRGIGWVQYSKDGTSQVVIRSQMLNTRWVIADVGNNEWFLANYATYAHLVHKADTQKEFHLRRGWRTEEHMFIHLKRYLRGKYRSRIMPLVKAL